MTGVLGEIIQLLTGGLTQMAAGIGSGLNELAQSIFLTGEGDAQTLSIYGGLIVIFAGVALAIGWKHGRKQCPNCLKTT